MKDILEPLRRAGIYMLIFSIGVNLLMLTVPLYMLQLFDRVIATRSGDTLILLSIIALTALIVLAGLDAARTRIMIASADWLDRRLSADLLLSALRRAQTSQTANGQGLRDLATVRSFVGGPGLFPLVDSPWVIIFTIAVFIIHPLLGWITVAGGVLLIAIAYLNEKRTRPLMETAGLATLTSLRQSDALIADADAVNAMGMAKNMINHWAVGQRKAWDELSLAGALNGDLTAAGKLVRLILQIATLGTGAWLATFGAITPGAMIAASIIVGRAMAPIEQALGGWRMFSNARAAWERLVVQLQDVAADGDTPPTRMPHPKGQLSVDGVSFAPKNIAVPILRSVSFDIAPGQGLGIVGPSGSGKTTLARLIVGAIRPSMGHVRLDGVEMSEWESDDRGPHIGYVPQLAPLPPARIRDIIGRLDGSDDKAIVAAAQLAGCHELVTGLPDGYETLIGPEGVMLSGGERQRIALARAVYGNPRLIVLDEPNAHLDGLGEAALVQTIASLKQNGATVVMVAHRPSALKYIDKLVVLNQGRVSHFGPRDEVLPAILPASALRSVEPSEQNS